MRASATETDFTVTGGSTAADDERVFRGGKGARGQTFSLRVHPEKSFRIPALV